MVFIVIVISHITLHTYRLGSRHRLPLCGIHYELKTQQE